MPRIFTGTYAQSPLYQFVDGAIKNIAKIRAKYPHHHAGIDSDERKEAQQLALVAESALTIAHTSVFYHFNNGTTPGLIALGKLGYNALKLHSLIESIKTRETILTYDIITNLPKYMANIPETANLTRTILTILDNHKHELIKDAAKIKGSNIDVIFEKIKSKIIELKLEEQPNNPPLNVLIPFITDHLIIDLWVPKDPMAFELMTLIANMIQEAPDKIFDVVPFIDPKIAPNLLQSRIIGALIRHFGAFSLEHIENTDDLSPSYVYNVTKEHGLKIYDAEEYYQHRTYFLHNTLRPALKRYLATQGPVHAETVPSAKAVITIAISKMYGESARTSLLKRFVDIEQEAINADVASYEISLISLGQALDIPTKDVLFQVNKKLALTQQFMNNLRHRLEAYNLQSTGALLEATQDRSLQQECEENEYLRCDLSFLNERLPTELPGGTTGPMAVGGPFIQIKSELSSSINEKINTLKINEKELIEKISQLTKTAIIEFEQQLNQINAKSVEAFLQENITPQEKIECYLSFNEQRHLLQQAISDLIENTKRVISTDSNADFTQILHTTNTLREKIQADTVTANEKIYTLKIQLSENLTKSSLSADPRILQAQLNDHQHQLLAIKTYQQLLREQLNSFTSHITFKQIELNDAQSNAHRINDQQTILQKTKHLKLNEMTLLLEQLKTNTSKTSANPTHKVQLFTELTAILKLLQENQNTNKFPFKAIERVMEPNLPAKQNGLVFDHLITYLKLELKDYKDYRERQERLFKKSPSPEEFKTMYAQLSAAIIKKIASVQRKINKDQELSTSTQNIRQTIQSIEQQQKNLLDEEQQLFDQQQSLQTKIQEITKEIEGFSKEKASIIDALSQAQANEVLHENNQKALTHAIAMLLDIASLKSKVELTGININDAELAEQLPLLQNTLEGLIEKSKAFNSIINQLTNPRVYEKTLSAMNDMLSAIHQQMISISQERAIRLQNHVPAVPMLEEQPNALIEPRALANDAEKRKELVNTFTLNLNAYKNTLLADTSMFDFIITNDKLARITLLDQVIDSLSNYAQSAEYENLLLIIRSHISDFKGVHLQSRLNKITATVLDFEQGLLEPESIALRDLENQQAAECLNQIKPQNTAYVDSINKLHEKINILRRYGETLIQKQSPSGSLVVQLADQLKRNTNHFIINHGGQVPSSPEYQAFREQFTARLHSEDDILSKDKSGFGRIVANIAFVLSWLIPGSLKPILNQAPFSLFSIKTKDEQHLDEIQSAENELKKTIHQAG